MTVMGAFFNVIWTIVVWVLAIIIAVLLPLKDDLVLEFFPYFGSLEIQALIRIILFLFLGIAWTLCIWTT